MGLPIAHDFEQNHAMEDRAGQTNTIRDFVRWATTLPQSVAVYFVCLVLIRRTFVLCRHAAAEEADRHRSAAGFSAAQLKLSQTIAIAQS